MKTMENCTILIDPGHGVDTPGKRSPFACHNGFYLEEWQYARFICVQIERVAGRKGVKCVRITTGNKDVPLSKRAKVVNSYIKEHPNERCVLFSIHGNAAGDGKKWMKAKGWEAWTTKGQNNSDKLASMLYDAISENLPFVKLRKDLSDGDPDKEKDFTLIYMAKCPAVLSENLFYDNMEEAEVMQMQSTIESIAKAHVDAAVKYFTS